MSSVLRSRTTGTTRAVGLALALALGLSGCGAGLRAQTYEERTTSDSTNDAIGALAVRHIRVLPPRGNSVYPAGGNAQVSLVVVNEGTEDDRLVSVTSDAASTVQVIGSGGRPASLTVPALSTASNYSFVLRGLTRELRPGNYVPLTLTFDVNGSETLLVPIELTGSPWPRREGYHVTPLDSNGDVLVEEGEGGHEGEGKGGQGEGGH